MLAIWALIPFYLIAVSALTPQSNVADYPKPLIPGALSISTVQLFLESSGIVPAMLNSVIVALVTVAAGLVLGVPAAYALARLQFRGREAFGAVVLVSRMFPIAILAIPLATLFVRLGLYDNLITVALVHTAMALPFVILIVGGAFAASPYDHEEAAETLGSSRWGAFLRVTLPPAVPGSGRRGDLRVRDLVERGVRGIDPHGAHPHPSRAGPRIAFHVAARAQARCGLPHGAAGGRVHRAYPSIYARCVGTALMRPLDRHRPYKPLDVGNGSSPER